ncbi:MAG: hypothetical protein U0234_19895 [Sandaracinus sp.]
MRRSSLFARLSLVTAGVLTLSCSTPAVAVEPACPRHDPESPSPSPPGPFTRVVLDPAAPAPFQLAVQACAGLRNRAVGGSVYVDADAHDAVWLTELALTPAASVDAADFLTACLADFPTCVRYDYASQRPLLPNVLTVAAALGAVPLDASLSVSCPSTVFDAVSELRDRSTPALATQYVLDTYGAQTSGLAMLNPGYEQVSSDPGSPAITRDTSGALVDFVFSQRLFVVFLVNGCIAGNPERDVLDAVVNAGRWETPLGVYGYNDSWNVAGGDLYEAQTRCLDSRNMGAIASMTSNLSFFSTRSAPITESDVVTQSAPEEVVYDPERTYVAFVVGDGDNIAYVTGARHDWLVQRLATCRASSASCPPLTWTISPHLSRLAPDVLRWYFDRSRETGHDSFALPPSGHLYAYPSSLEEGSQERFARATEEDACILGVHGTVHWDWAGTWREAESTFLPRYARVGGQVRGVFSVNVPYLVDPFPRWPRDRFFEVLSGPDGGRVALFRPREWRGVDDDTSPFFLSPARMAEEIGGYPRGTVTWVYMTSDGGLTLDNSFTALAGLLPEHVQLVSADTAASLALVAPAR